MCVCGKHFSGTRYAPLDTSTTLFHYSFIISRYHSFTLSAIKINYTRVIVHWQSSTFEGYALHRVANAHTCPTRSPPRFFLYRRRSPTVTRVSYSNEKSTAPSPLSLPRLPPRSPWIELRPDAIISGFAPIIGSAREAAGSIRGRS